MLKLRFRRLVGQCRDLERPFTHSEVISVIFSILSVGRCMDKDPNLEANQNTLFYFHRSRANLEGGQGGRGSAGQGALVFNVKHAAMERGVAVGRERGRGGPSLPPSLPYEGRQAPFLRRSLPRAAATLLHPGLDAIFGRGGGGDLS